MGRRILKEIPSPFPQCSVVEMSDKPYLLIRIYDAKTQRYSYRSTGTVDEQKAMALLPEIYQAWMASPDQYKKEHRITTLELLEKFIEHTEQRHKRGEIQWNTMNGKRNTCRVGVLQYLTENQLLRIPDLNPKRHFKDYPTYRLDQGIKHSTVVAETKTIKEWVKWCYQQGYLKTGECFIDVPRKAIEQGVVPIEDGNAYTDEEVTNIVANLAGKVQNSTGVSKQLWQTTFRFFTMMLHSGCRTTELWNVQFQDCLYKTYDALKVQKLNLKIRVSKTGYRETIIESNIPLLQKDFLQDKGVKVDKTTSVWCNPNTGKPFSIKSIRNKFYQVLVEEGLEETHRLYDARATYITERLLNSGNKLSTYVLAKAVGNSEQQIRATYENLMMRDAAGVLTYREYGEAAEFSPMV